MDVYRKPATAEWYYDSAQRVDSQELTREPWSGVQRITFDGTKDKTGDRHTTMRVVLTETDVERLYAGLHQGRKRDIRDLTKQRDQLRKELNAAKAAICTHIDAIQELWVAAGSGSDTEATFEKLKTDFEKALEKANESWRWTW